MNEVKIKPIGLIHTEFKNKEGMPIQGNLNPNNKGEVEVYDEYLDGIFGLDGFSHIILIYIFHESKRYNLKQKPFLENKEFGVFAIRSPIRPNPIGFTIVNLDGIEKNILHISGVDMLDKTPLLDIKPYVPQFDKKENVRIGWLKNRINKNHLSDGRFK